MGKKEAIEKQVVELDGAIQKLEAQLVKERERATQLEEAVTKCNNTYTGNIFKSRGAPTKAILVYFSLSESISGQQCQLGRERRRGCW